MLLFGCSNLPYFYTYLLFKMYKKVSHMFSVTLRREILLILSYRAHGVARRDLYGLRIGLVEESYFIEAVKSSRKHRILSHLWTRFNFSMENQG